MSSLQAVAEMLKREFDASKSVSDHLAFLRQVAEDPVMAADLRNHLITHIGEEEAEHQEHLGRLLPALDALAQKLDKGEKPSSGGKPKAASAAPAPAPAASSTNPLTVGSLIGKRPWHVTAR